MSTKIEKTERDQQKRTQRFEQQKKQKTIFENLEDFFNFCEEKGGLSFGKDYIPANKDKVVLLVSHELKLNGAPIALLYMAQSLQKLGFKPVAVSPSVGPVLDAYLQERIPVLIAPELFETALISQLENLFSFIILNTAQCANLACYLNGKRTPVLWWIHEAGNFYETKYAQEMPEWLFPNIKVVTAGSWARRILLQYRPNYQAEDQYYWIPDVAAKNRTGKYALSSEAEGKHVFALVGSIESRKGQDVFLEAIKLLPESIICKCFFVFVGQDNQSSLGSLVRNASVIHPERIQYILQIGRDDMPAFYNRIDCLICASRDDPLPVVIAEACQFSKTIICSENTGTAPLLEQHGAGIIYHNDDPNELSQSIMRICSFSSSDLAVMQTHARELYLTLFSPDSFMKRLETEILPALMEISKRLDQIDWGPNSILYHALSDTLEKLSEKDKTIRDQIDAIEEQNQQLLSAEERIEHLEEQNHYLSESFDMISNSTFWKITKPARVTLDVLKWSLRPHSEKHLLRMGLYSLRTNGARVTWQKAINKIYFGGRYASIAEQALFTEQELIEQREHHFPYTIKFSIIVPLYNTPERFLREMIDSVRTQTYAGWELCMADGSDAMHSDVQRICQEYMGEDKRIRYRKLEGNRGISGNTNACIEMASGDYIGLFDHDDLLHPAALYEVMRTIEKTGADFIYTDECTMHDTSEEAYLPHFKPDFAPDNLRANNYICHFTVFKHSLLDEVGLFDPACDGSQDHDMVLRLTEKAERVAHIPEILYYWRAHAGSSAESVGVKPYVIHAGVQAVEKQLARLGLEGTVEPVRPGLTIYRTRFKIIGTPKISIIIPNYEHLKDLKTCLDSIFKKTTWPSYEIVIVENNSKSPALFSYYESLQKKHQNVRVVTWTGQFNYSAINNFGAKYCAGDYLLLLNNDIEIITSDWIEEMLMFAQRKDVGAVGAMLYFHDKTIQHAGVCLGMGGVAGHYYWRVNKRNNLGYMGRLLYPQDVTAVTAACMLLRRDIWDKVGGMDEDWTVAFNDVDLCMRIRQSGYVIVWTPFAELYHYESKSRGAEDTPEKQKRFEDEVIRFQSRWAKELEAGDPYYNPNFTLDKSDFSVKQTAQQYDAR